MPLQLAFSSNAYLDVPIEQAIERIAGIGYKGIELLADVPHAWPAGLLEVQKEAIRQAIARSGLAISNINAFMMNAIADPRQPYWHPGWTDPDPHYRAIRREHTKRALKLAAEIGAAQISTEPGGELAVGQSRKNATDIFYDEILPCLDVAAKCGVTLMIEPEPGLLIEKFAQYLEFAERVNHPALGLNFDIGHAFCVGEDPAEWVPRMQPHTRHYHFEDIASSRVHHHLVPGEGAIDFAGVFQAIAQHTPDTWITVELYPYREKPDEAAQAARAYLLAIARQSGVEID
ncbi:MAG: sugar phosphate isomerase/epimerase [Planctomycetia bacterium]|jgi:sugar phosphate isomerase/epimerase|nr:sugar phosphate isomerase/epimerase [Planctomycetia bacterium]